MTNTKLTWTRPEHDLPNDFREVLISQKDFPEILIGFYSEELGSWITCIDGENTIINNIEYWMDKPEKPTYYDNGFVFRTAKEAKYLTEVRNKACEEDSEYKNFCKVRIEIMTACTNGLWTVTLSSELITPRIQTGLEKAGFQLIKNDVENSITISWKNEE